MESKIATLDVGVLLKTVERWADKARTTRKQADREYRELMELSGPECRRRIERSTKRFRSPFLADLLLDESRRRFFDSPTGAFEIAEAADQVALQLSVWQYGDSIARDIRTRAAAYKANVLRCGGDLRGADRLMSEPLGRLWEVTDPQVVAEVLWLASSLRREQQRFEEGVRLLQQAVDTYRELDDLSLAGTALVSLGELLRDAGVLDEALDAVRAALELLSVRTDQEAYVCARHNLALYLCDAGLFTEARAEFEANSEFYPLFPGSWSETRQLWLEGKIAAGLGEGAVAEEAFRQAKRAFVAENRAIDAALVSLDLALLLEKLGRTQDILSLAEEMLGIFRAHEIYREATAALILFQEAAKREALEAGLVHELVDYLERARSNPNLVFERRRGSE